MDVDTINFCFEEHDGDIDEYSYINDCLVMDYCIDFDLVAESLSAPGEYEIFTCDCGEAGCAGIKQGVLVEHENEFVKLTVSQPFKTKYTFLRQALIDDLLECSHAVYKDKLEVGSTIYMIFGATNTLRILESIN